MDDKTFDANMQQFNYLKKQDAMAMFIAPKGAFFEKTGRLEDLKFGDMFYVDKAKMEPQIFLIEGQAYALWYNPAIKDLHGDDPVVTIYQPRIDVEKIKKGTVKPGDVSIADVTDQAFYMAVITKAPEQNGMIGNLTTIDKKLLSENILSYMPTNFLVGTAAKVMEKENTLEAYNERELELPLTVAVGREVPSPKPRQREIPFDLPTEFPELPGREMENEL